jgi:uncharacterized membrane protein
MRFAEGLPVIRRAAVVGSAFALALLAALSIGFKDLLMQWQPAPADTSWRTPVAYFSGVVLFISAVGLVMPTLRRRAALIAAVWIGLWVVFLHVPTVIATKNNFVGAILGVAECSAMALGLATLAVKDNSSITGQILVRLFGVCLVIFGLSHFVYADFTAGMVPAWLPQRLAIAYLTGAIHAITGILLLIGVWTQLAASIEAAMMTSFVLLLHIPHVSADPHNRLELTMLGVATLLSSAAWLVATRSVNLPDTVRAPAP